MRTLPNIDLTVTNQDRDILRRLAAQQAEIAALPVQAEKAELWRRLNDLQPQRPMVWITEIPWHEMNADDELTLRTSTTWLQGIERELRRRLYQWRHLPVDMIMDDYIACPKVVHSTGLGISEDVDIRVTDKDSDIYSRQFHRQIASLQDVDKIKTPVVTFDREATEQAHEAMESIFGDILPVREIGFKGKWFAPWDELIRWFGVEQAMTDLIDRPELVHCAMARLMDAKLAELDQWQALGLLDRNDDNTRVGSGGYGYTADLPGETFNPKHVRTENMWGCATAQIFSEVSEAMHQEFALQHEMRWLQRWGLVYYGCCEPLDGKMTMLRTIPRLRKISMSPRINIDRAVREVGDGFVFSRKPNPAVLAWEAWRPDAAKKELEDFLHAASGCCIEIILKDISTVHYQPQRLWEWASIAMSLVQG
ncbi:MAG: hypothetical protein BWY83_00230 [bacterium ADurb.Bin478]|nr:MAG: hypothetical protein BWY83_00230 [bacterium ADurb.Bin478]